MALAQTTYDRRASQRFDGPQSDDEGALVVKIDEPAILYSGMKVSVTDLPSDSMRDGVYRLTTADIVVLSELEA